MCCHKKEKKIKMALSENTFSKIHFQKCSLRKYIVKVTISKQ